MLMLTIEALSLKIESYGLVGPSISFFIIFGWALWARGILDLQQGIEHPCRGSLGSLPQDHKGSLVLAFRVQSWTQAQKGSQYEAWGSHVIFTFCLWMLTPTTSSSLNNSETDCCESTQFCHFGVSDWAGHGLFIPCLPEKGTQVSLNCQGTIFSASVSELSQSEPLWPMVNKSNRNKHCNRPDEGTARAEYWEQDSILVSNNYFLSQMQSACLMPHLC